MDVDVQLCDTSEDEDENIESELESDEISEDERDYKIISIFYNI